MPHPMLKCFAGNWMCLVPSTSHSALGVDAEVDLPEGRNHIFKGYMTHPSCPSLSPLQRPLEPYEPRWMKTIPKCHLLLWFALWIALCRAAEQMSSIINSNRRELCHAGISNAFLHEGHCGAACNTLYHQLIGRDLLWRGEGDEGKSLCLVQVEPARAKFTLYSTIVCPAPANMGNLSLQVWLWAVLQHKKLSALQQFDFVLT